MRRALSEYAVGGIKTTLPFFREVMRDPEFVAGRLDTGFIARFNERRRAADASRADEPTAEETTRRDMALIAAALAYAEPAHDGSRQQPPQPPPSARWWRHRCRARSCAYSSSRGRRSRPERGWSSSRR